MRYITELSEKGKQQLREEFRNGATHRFRIRCQSILLSAEGYQINQLASMFQVDRDTISRWFDKWESDGIAGRPAKLRIENAQHVREVKKQVEKERQNLDKVRSELTNSLQVEVSRKTLKRFLKSLAAAAAVLDGNVSDYHLSQGKIL